MRTGDTMTQIIVVARISDHYDGHSGGSRGPEIFQGLDFRFRGNDKERCGNDKRECGKPSCPAWRHAGMKKVDAVTPAKAGVQRFYRLDFLDTDACPGPRSGIRRNDVGGGTPSRRSFFATWQIGIPLLVVFLCMACFGCERQPSHVATVNGEAISLGEFQKSLAEQMTLAGGGAPLTVQETERLKKAVLDNLITDNLMLQRARSLSISVSEGELAARIEEIRKDYNGQFNTLFGGDGVDFSAWKEALRKRMIIVKIISRDVNAGIQIPEKDAERYFAAHRKVYAIGKRVRVAQIVLPDIERAAGALKRLKAGEDFGKVSKEASIGPEAEKGGDLGYFEEGIMPVEIDSVVFSLPVGRVSGVVKSPYGFHIFKVLDRETAGGLDFEDVKEKVIADLRKQEEAEAYRDWIDNLRSKAAIRINQKQISEVPIPRPRKPEES
jgi:parvulin-like peptidyl-prolyl isomerase